MRKKGENGRFTLMEGSGEIQSVWSVRGDERERPVTLVGAGGWEDATRQYGRCGGTCGSRVGALALPLLWLVDLGVPLFECIYVYTDLADSTEGE